MPIIPPSRSANTVHFDTQYEYVSIEYVTAFNYRHTDRHKHVHTHADAIYMYMCVCVCVCVCVL